MISFTIAALAACTRAQPLSPHSARQILADSWQADQHTIWEIDWPEVPISGPVTVESWRADDRLRLEVLESPAAALVGESLVFDGQDAWRYNRFDPPSSFTPTAPLLSPVSDVFAIIDRLIDTLPQQATVEEVRVDHASTQKIVVSFLDSDSLTLWRDVETGLPVRIIFSRGGRPGVLQAREFEPLVAPPEGLFGVGDWIGGVP